MLHGLSRRSTSIAAGTLLLTGVLSSCGFDYATNRVNTISSGVNEQDGEVDVLGAAIISGSPDTGVFVGSLASANRTEQVTLTGVGGEVTAADELEPVVLEPLGSVSLYQLGGIPITGPIGLGEFVDVELTFDNGQTTTASVAVMRPCEEYDPAKFPGMVVPGFVPAPEGEEESAEDAVTTATDPYSCNRIEPEPHGEEEGEGEE